MVSWGGYCSFEEVFVFVVRKVFCCAVRVCDGCEVVYTVIGIRCSLSSFICNGGYVTFAVVGVGGLSCACAFFDYSTFVVIAVSSRCECP